MAAACSFCRKDTSRTVHGPGLSICETCLQRFQASPQPSGAQGACAFCGRSAQEVQALDSTPEAGGKAICGDCVENLLRTL